MIKSIYPVATNLLITDDTGKAVAVIACTPNVVITTKVELAIKEDLCADKVKVIGNYEIQYDDIEIKVETIDEEQEKDVRIYSLSKIAVYK
jgi:hypothetical protein